MIIGTSNAAAIFKQTQTAGSKLAGGVVSSNKTQETKGDEKEKKFGETLTTGMKGAEETKEKQGAKKKKEADQKKEAKLDAFGSESFATKEEKEKTSPDMEKLDLLRQQAKEFKRTGSFSGKVDTSRTEGSTPKESGKHIKTHKSKEQEGHNRIDTTDEVKGVIDEKYDDIQQLSGTTTRENKDKVKVTTQEVEEQAKTKKKQETVHEKGQQDSGQKDKGSGDKTLEDLKIKKLEKAEKIKKSTPLQDASEATDNLKDFQNKTGISTKALEKSKEMAETVLKEQDPVKKSKRTNMKSVEGIKKIEGNEKPAPLQDIVDTKNQPLAVLKDMTGKEEMVETKLPEKETKPKLEDMETAPLKSERPESFMSEIKESDGPQKPEGLKNLKHTGSIEISQEYSKPQKATDKGKAAFKEKYGLELKGNTQFYQSETGSTIVDNLGDKPAKSPLGNLFDGKEHQVTNLTPQGGSAYETRPDKDNPDRVFIKGAGIPGGDEWYGDIQKSKGEDGKDIYKTNIYGKPEKDGSVPVWNTVSEVSGNKENTKIDTFVSKTEGTTETPQQGQAGEVKSHDFGGMTEYGKAEKVPSDAKIRGIDSSSAVRVQSQEQCQIQVGETPLQVQSSKQTFIDGVPEDSKGKGLAELMFDGKEHNMVMSEQGQTSAGQFGSNTTLKLVPDKNNPGRLTFTGECQHSMMGEKNLSVRGEAIVVKDEKGKDRVEIRYNLIDPQSGQVVFSGERNEMPDGKNRSKSMGKFYEGPLPYQQQFDQQLQQASNVPQWKPEQGEVQAASFLNTESGLIDFTYEEEKGVKSSGGSSGAKT